MSTNLTVANTILAQLGGRRFTTMTGAKNFVGTDHSLYFSIPRSKGINKVEIKLNEMDTYDVTFYKTLKLDLVEIKKVEGVYADNLQEVFTNATGLYTRL